MPAPVTVAIPHELGRAEARRRIERAFRETVAALPGSAGTPTERWEGDRLVFGVTAMGQAIHGVVDVDDTVVTMEIQLPRLLALIAGSLAGRIRKAGRQLLE